MTKIPAILYLAIVICIQSLWAQIPAGPPSESELAAITARGRLLSEYDAAAWHASDAIQASKPDQTMIKTYAARKTAKGWVVAWGKFNQDRTAFLVAYEANASAGSNEYKVTRHDPPLEDRDVYFREAKALETAHLKFLSDRKPERIFNFSILPGPSANWYVYAIPAQTDLSILPYGGDVRYLVSADGEKIVDERQMHQDVFEVNISRANFMFHTHILSDVPEDSDVFYAMTAKSQEEDWIVTKRYSYSVNSTGALRYRGQTTEIAKLMQAGKCAEPCGNLPPSAQAMLLPAIKHLVEETQTAKPPLEVFTTLLGARCNHGTIWLQLNTIAHNVSEGPVILRKDGLQNLQARFAATEADLLADKYEKLVFTSIPEQIDFSDNAYVVLPPGVSTGHDQEYPIAGLDLKGKTAAQFLYFTWPLGKKDQAASEHARLTQTGDLFVDDLLSSPFSLNIDPELLKTCIPQK